MSDFPLSFLDLPFCRPSTFFEPQRLCLCDCMRTLGLPSSIQRAKHKPLHHPPSNPEFIKGGSVSTEANYTSVYKTVHTRQGIQHIPPPRIKKQQLLQNAKCPLGSTHSEELLGIQPHPSKLQWFLKQPTYTKPTERASIMKAQKFPPGDHWWV